MRRVSNALNLRDNDALWSVLAVLEYYPHLLSQQGKGMPRYYNINSTGSCIRKMIEQLSPVHAS
jgi:hypothetical protein